MIQTLSTPWGTERVRREKSKKDQNITLEKSTSKKVKEVPERTKIMFIIESNKRNNKSTKNIVDLKVTSRCQKLTLTSQKLTRQLIEKVATRSNTRKTNLNKSTNLQLIEVKRKVTSRCQKLTYIKFRQVVDLSGDKKKYRTMAAMKVIERIEASNIKGEVALRAMEDVVKLGEKITRQGVRYLSDTKNG